jgi:hypothetical protein
MTVCLRSILAEIQGKVFRVITRGRRWPALSTVYLLLPIIPPKQATAAEARQPAQLGRRTPAAASGGVSEQLIAR